MMFEGKNNEQALKVFFGLIIFAFSLAFAYFVAAYLDKKFLLDYWGALMIAAGVFITIGVFVANILPISLGFLFSADILVLHVLMDNFGHFNDGIKALFVGMILLILYLVAWVEFPHVEFEHKVEPAKSPTPQPTPSVVKDDVFQVEPVPPANELNKLLEQIDVRAFHKVTFQPAGQAAFSTTEPSIIRIALYTKQTFGKGQFAPGELADYFQAFVNTYIPTLSEEKVKVVVAKMKEFVSLGGKFEIT